MGGTKVKNDSLTTTKQITCMSTKGQWLKALTVKKSNPLKLICIIKFYSNYKVTYTQWKPKYIYIHTYSHLYKKQ